MERDESVGPEPEICVVFSTVPAAESSVLAKCLIEQRLVACVNIVPVRSYYRWKGEFCDDEEHLLIAKTRKELVKRVITELKKLHPNEVPEIIALPVFTGHAPYLEWVYEETK